MEQPRQRLGRPRYLTDEERKARHAEYMKHYYANNKARMDDNAKRSYLRMRQKHTMAPADAITTC